MGINNEWLKVKEFHQKFNHPASEKPVMLEPDRVQKRYNWMLEEIGEFQTSKTITDQADAMIDLIYFGLGTLVEMGIKPEKLFEIVHNANMAKLWEDGKPHYNHEGKTIKPSTWEDPYKELELIIQNEI